MTLLSEFTNQREESRKNRREALEELARRYGGVRALAIAISRSPEQIYALLADRRSVGDKLARDIEEKLSLESGSLDMPVDKSAVKKAEPVAQKPRIKITKIPLLSFVQAGSMTDVGDLNCDEYVEMIGDFPSGCFALRIKGDSMKPLMDEGDVIVVDPSRWPSPGDCVVARSNLENLNEATVKRYHPIGFDESGRDIFELRPLNDNYRTMHSVNQKLQVIGTVCKLVKDL